MINCIIHAKKLEKLNEEIIRYNKDGWVVKQIFVNDNVINTIGGIYALLERQGSWK